MALYQHQIVAVQQGATADAARALKEIQGILAVGGDKNPLTGLARTHEPHTDQDELPAERRLVQLTIAALLSRYAAAEAALLDVQYTRETGNTQAAAPVEIDGQEILPAVPVGFLLFIEEELKGILNGLLNRLQVRDPAEEWHHDEDDPPGVWRSASRETLSTAKRLTATPAWPPAAEIPPPPVEWRDTDVVTGRWSWVKYSGQLSMNQVYEIRQRASQLLAAVRAAREAANRAEVQQQRAGRQILGYVFGDLIT